MSFWQSSVRNFPSFSLILIYTFIHNSPSSEKYVTHFFVLVKRRKTNLPVARPKKTKILLHHLNSPYSHSYIRSHSFPELFEACNMWLHPVFSFAFVYAKPYNHVEDLWLFECLMSQQKQIFVLLIVLILP